MGVLFAIIVLSLSSLLLLPPGTYGQLNLTSVRGTNAGEVCGNFEKLILGPPGDVFQSSCTCIADEDGSYDVDCGAECYVNVNGKEFKHSLSTALKPFSGEGGGFHGKFWEQCHKYVDSVFEGMEICFKEDYFSSFNGEKSVEVNGETCNSVETVQGGCGGGGVGISSFVVLINCTNLGYGESMNFCDGTGIEADSPFSFIYSSMQAEDPSEIKGNCGTSAGNDSSPSSNSSSSDDGSSSASRVWFGVSGLICSITAFALMMRYA